MSLTARSRQGGFSLIEALIAMVLVATIILGIMPLFTNSIVQNVSGKESTVASNFSRSSAEELTSLPLDRLALRPAPAATEREVCQTYDEGSGWDYVVCGAPIVGNPTWTRQTMVRQYNIREIYDGDTAAGIPTFKNPIPGYDPTDERFDSYVQIRELMIATEGQRTADSPLGPGRRVDMVSLRGF
jgi:type II secretory pathway pseudopilin PulG